MTIEELVTNCTDWKPAKLSFCDVIGAALTLGNSQRELAREFEVAESTVSRWARGVARPHPRLQLQIVKSVKRRAKRLIKADVRPSFGLARASPMTIGA